MLNLKVTENNYSAVVVKINTLLELEGCDNLLWVPMLGLQALVSKDYKEGELYLMFPAEVQLSDDFCSNNNLYRHSDLNLDPNAKGYIEDNRRVRAVKLRGHISSALLVPLNFLCYLTDVSYNDLKEWDSFDTINDIEICKKYIVFKREPWTNRIGGKNKRFQRIDNKVFPEHFDSDNFWINERKYKPTDLLVVTQKLHGTSARFGYVKTRRQLKWYERVLRWLGVKINDIEYDHIYASRTVIINWTVTKDYTWFYKTNVWEVINERYGNRIPKDYIIYGEIVWRDWQWAIQKNYTYGLPQWEMELYVYRISIVNDDGLITDLSWDNIREFCKLQWMKPVPELWRGIYLGLDINEFMEKRYFEQWYTNCLPLSHPTLPDEWVIVRREGIIPYLTKAKCQWFLVMESKERDSGVVDMESAQSQWEIANEEVVE